MKPTDNPTAESKLRLWTTWCNYYGTGEGVTVLARIGYAQNEQQCRDAFAKAFDPFWAQGAEFAPGVARNEVTKLLFSEEILRQVESLDSRGAVELTAQLHYNLA